MRGGEGGAKSQRGAFKERWRDEQGAENKLTRETRGKQGGIKILEGGRGAFKRRWRDEKGSGEQPTRETRDKQGEMEG